MAEEIPPRPAPRPIDELVARTETIEIDRSPERVHAMLVGAPLEDLVRATPRLPHVVGTEPLTPGPFGAVGSRRRVRLSDGASAVEEVLDTGPDGFLYQVWAYTSRAARPIRYALGRFDYAPLTGGRTQLVWTYAFELDRARFPGVLGPLGPPLLRLALLDGPYADLMRTALAAIKSVAEDSSP